MEDIDSGEHGPGPKQARRVAHYWRANVLGGLDMLTADFPTQRFRRHWHPGYTIGVVTRGAERFFCRGEYHVVGVGGLIAVNPEDTHDGEPAAEGGWAYRMIYPTEDLVREVCAELADADYANGTPLFRDAVVLDAQVARQFVGGHRAVEEARSRSGTTAMEAETRLFLASVELLRRHACPDSGHGFSASTADKKRLGPALDLIEADLTGDLSLGALANAVGLGRYRFLRMFKASFGGPPHKYVMQRRVAQAKALLGRGISATDAALETGFYDQSHLANVFRQTYGMTPGDYQLGTIHR